MHENTRKNLIDYYRAYPVYLNQDYVRDAITVIDNRINSIGYSNKTDKEIATSYASKWSGLSRTRRSGFLVSIAYYIAWKEQLDLTATLGYQLLKGIFGLSVNFNTAVRAFSTKGRDAKSSSADFQRLEQICKDYQPWALEKQRQLKYRIACNRDLAFEMYQKRLEDQKLSKVKNASSKTKTAKSA